ncbi:MAG: hypothetical protein FWC41_00040 [Firmicutes bacterium]|nr:hypothetical protein [Bacillota bacterium]
MLGIVMKGEEFYDWLTDSLDDGFSLGHLLLIIMYIPIVILLGGITLLFLGITIGYDFLFSIKLMRKKADIIEINLRDKCNYCGKGK